MAVNIDANLFYSRLERLVSHWAGGKSAWGGADVICVPAGPTSDEVALYSKSAAFFLYMLGIECPDTIIFITKTTIHFMTSTKKIQIIEGALGNREGSPVQVHYIEKVKDEGANKESMHNLLNIARKNGGKIGFPKGNYEGSFIPVWLSMIDSNQLEKVDISSGLGYFLSVKDDSELDNCKRAAVFTNKVFKHSFIQEMEDAIDKDVKVKHSKLAAKVEEVIFDPNKIGLKISSDIIEVCYNPIIQSGGKYDIKVSAQSDDNTLSHDVIICSIGTRYKGYCANMSRTFMVDVPPKVEKTYAVLMSLYNHCLEQMVPGKELKDVLLAATKYIEAKDSSLLQYLPKSLGFSIGLEFRDSTLVLNNTNTAKFAAGMMFNLSVGFHNIPLTQEERGKAPSAQKLSVFSLLIGDTVLVQKDQAPEILTKTSKEFADCSYNINDKDDDDEDDDDEDDDAKSKIKAEKEDEGGVRRSARSKEEKSANEEAAIQRQLRQREVMARKIKEAKAKMVSGEGASAVKEDTVKEAVELQVYRSSEDYPKDVIPNQVRVDMDKECMILPINGQPVPFHISTIKNVTMPEQDRQTWMRINFYVPGAALGKEVNKNTQQLVIKHGSKFTFIKELTFRSLNSRNLQHTFQQWSELRKRIRQRELKAEQEKDLVVQTKLIRIKDQRVPRLQDITMRPQISGRKCVGVLEAHQNGLRFMSTKGETLDIMYANTKHCIYQPCDKTTMVLIHFHLKDPIMIGKKKQKDVQFFTEVIEASLNLESSRRSSYDPDELDDEQREREMRRRLNTAFKEFCLKVEKVAAHYDFSLQIDVPFRKSSFEGTCFREMVLLQPTTHCLVNLTETPSFVISLADIEHVHFERVTYATKNFDMTFIFKNLDQPTRTITAVDMKYLDIIQDWLNLVEITYTIGTITMKWTDTIKAVKESIEDGIFYDEVDFEGDKKDAGWLFLNVYGAEDEEEEGAEGDEDDSEFSEDSEEESSEEESESDESDYDDEDDDSDEYDEEDELSEEGKDWDELEKDAIASDKAKRSYEEDDGGGRGGKNGGGGGGNKKQRR